MKPDQYEPVKGEFFNCRNLRHEYDYQIKTQTKNFMVEANGLSDFKICV